ncbi:hypothetical protein [Methylomonas koyamae]|uniref:Uncharacterized protein n=1 Tax=Methylomonas koyamae TaxID=702114 RepID=A0A291IMR8_9GAMM|nr:hypothetical protein [Methylomonas koyamae]ATG91498.1 hypothetical protein MKLM6_3308 [Methylomonas koyamae]OAI26886.1 hypothetical protein A1356_10770 [Methylomonas koyamae]
MTNKINMTDLGRLDSEIRLVHIVVASIIIVTLASYSVWFWWLNSQTISTSVESWGQLGDYVGGILNPCTAYAAYYWLTRSIRLQKEEMLEARLAMEAASKSQAEQAHHSQVQVRVSALTALINSIMVEVQTQRMQLQHLLVQAEKHHAGAAVGFDGVRLNSQELANRVAEINNQISKRMNERYDFEQQLKTLLNQYNS